MTTKEAELIEQAKGKFHEARKTARAEGYAWTIVFEQQMKEGFVLLEQVEPVVETEEDADLLVDATEAMLEGAFVKPEAAPQAAEPSTQNEQAEPPATPTGELTEKIERLRQWFDVAFQTEMFGEDETEVIKDLWNCLDAQQQEIERRQKMHNSTREHETALVHEVTRLTAENAKLKEENKRLADGPRHSWCTYCTWEKPDATLEEIKAHIESCQFHPLAKLRTSNAALQTTNEELRTAWMAQAERIRKLVCLLEKASGNLDADNNAFLLEEIEHALAPVAEQAPKGGD